MPNISPKLKEKLNKVLGEQAADRIAVAFAYNLHPDIPMERCNGIICCDSHSLMQIQQDKLLFSLPLSEIETFVSDMGVGCTFLSYKSKKDGKTRLLCRADMKLSKAIIRNTRSLNRFIENGKTFEKEEEAGKLCPKCGRPYRRGSHICLHCDNKTRLVKRVWKMISPYKLFVFMSVAMFFIISAMRLLLPYVNRIAVDDYIRNTSENVSIHGFILVLLSMVGLELLLRLLSSIRSHLLVSASNKMIVDLRNNLFDKIQRLSLAKISAKADGDLMRRVTHDTTVIDNFLVSYLPSVLEQLAVFVAVGVFLLIYDPILFLLIMAPTPFVVISFNSFWRFMRTLFRKRWTAGTKSNSVLHDIFSGIRVVKAFGMEARESERYEECTAEEKRMQEKTDCLWSILMPILQFFVSFGEFIILYYVGNRILGGSMTPGEMTQFSAYAGMIYGPLRMVAHIPRHLVQFLTSSAKVFEILDENEEVADSDKSQEIEIKGSIDINNISFGYDSGKEVLHKIDIHIAPGEFIGLVGASGVGKSTLINLIMRMYDVEEGSITIDGMDIRDISQNSLRSQMGVVLQETFLFSGSVYQNIAYAKPNATREEVIAVSKLAGCHEFITRLPDGYNTRVGERGSTLSGGERQRVAIARALLHNPKILILDEATASLDTETEKQIQDALANLSKSRTTIAIAHRLSTLRNATRLVVLDKGKVAEVGTHEQLMEKEGIYYGLVMAQREMSEIK